MWVKKVTEFRAVGGDCAITDALFFSVADTGFPEIFGQTDYGDDVEDEWFIVFLLRQLTMVFPGLIVR